jgi:ATP-dependent DNA helicase UvrD/PcrA
LRDDHSTSVGAPTPAQLELMGLPPCEVVAIAPPGCGKTEALALRAQGLVRGGHVPPPRRVLAVTFSNPAKRNLQERMRLNLGSASVARRVTILNFHGLAARVVTAHGSTVGLGPDLVLPERGWYGRIFEERSTPWPQRRATAETVRRAKQSAIDDDQVADLILRSGDELALELERIRIEENRLDFDDLIRHAVAILQVERVAALYRAHFTAVLVDELQDMTSHQLSLVSAVGEGRTTYAGDPSQGIYGFAGAEPAAVITTIMEREPILIALTESYRSAPAVLKVVNALSIDHDELPISCAKPDQWEGDGEVRVVRFPSPTEEASGILDLGVGIIDAMPEMSIGIISRVSSRKRTIEQEAVERGLDCEYWDRALYSPEVRSLISRVLPRLRPAGLSHDETLDALRDLCIEATDPADADTLDEIMEAIDLLRRDASQGIAPLDALATLRVESELRTVRPGLHFLNAHRGKGQQFDWVVVLGMEEGFIPSYLAASSDELDEEFRILRVLCSRARYGLVFTVCRDVRSSPSRQWLRAESRWLPQIEPYVTGEGLPS